MCYSGKCPYEDHQGDCTLPGTNYPDDALCLYGDEPEMLTEDEEQARFVAFIDGYHETRYKGEK